MVLKEIAEFLPREAAEAAVRGADALTEIRVRAGRPVQLVFGATDQFCGQAVEACELRRMLLAMMDHSYYAREEELRQGFFTMRGGCRVGVCGSYSLSEGGECSMRAIGSVCVRIARQVKGCAEPLMDHLIEDGRMRSTIILSRPGMGKTTLLRDVARLLSQRGFTVGIADERHELAACRDGVPTLDVGERSDVADGCPKHLAMGFLIRSMAPKVIVTDEIGNARDAVALREASRQGIAVVASAHGAGFDALEHGMLKKLTDEGCFRLAVLLDGAPGNICGLRQRGDDARWK